MKNALEKLTKQDNNLWPDFFNTVNKELFLVEENLTTKLSTKSKLLKEIISFIFKAGGKRIRPAISLLIAKSTGEITKRHIILAELTELIHTASLIHDDIIDSAKLRRGKETINNLWNDKISVITGDFLFAEASVRLGELENTEIVKIYAKVLSDLCDGEIEQYSTLFDPDITWEHYLQKSTTKTASLFAACCISASILNSQSNLTNEMANKFGNHLGIAFQVVDDILDFTSSSKKIGKEVGTDLKQGIITAPTLFALNSTDKRREQIRLLIKNRFNNNKDDFDTAIKLISELGGCEKAKQLAFEHIDHAKQSLSFIKDNEIRSNLLKIADYILSRV